jgi:hypothetical protein
MKNLSNVNEQSLDELPKRVNARAGQSLKKYHRNAYPWSRVRRFLRSNVGELWNDVYSKYCNLPWVLEKDKRLEQISYSVELNTFIQNGQVFAYQKYRSNPVNINDIYGNIFYVHPTTHTLCFQPQKVRVHINKDVDTIRILGDYHQLLKIKGIWYEVKAEPIIPEIIEIDGLHYKSVKWTMFAPGELTKNRYKFIGKKVFVPVINPSHTFNKPIGPRDRLIPNSSKGVDYYLSGNDRLDYYSIKIVKRRQLKSKELKKYKLKNDLKLPKPKCLMCGSSTGMCYHGKN